MPTRRVMGLDRRQLVLIGGLLLVGTALRVWIAFANYGVAYDTNTAYDVARLLASHPLHAYASLRYPYPPGYFPVLLVCRWLSELTGAQFWAVWKLPAVIADAGIAVTLVWGLGRLGAGPRARILTVALVMLGPIFVLVSGYHGQLDPAAILPALIAVILWHLDVDGRAWKCGVLIGIGCAIKTVPLFMVLALLPTVRSWREAWTLIACAVAVPAVCIAPFLIDAPGITKHSLTYNRGVPGFGGLSVLVQPSLERGWVSGHLPPITNATWFFVHKQNLIVGVAVLLAGAYAWRMRMDAISSAVLIWLVVYVANFNWSFQYFDWGLPFFLLAGRRREALALQLLLLLPAFEFYPRIGNTNFGWAYFPLIMLAWCAILAAAVAVMVRRRATGSLLLPGDARRGGRPVSATS